MNVLVNRFCFINLFMFLVQFAIKVGIFQETVNYFIWVFILILHVPNDDENVRKC